jgi:AraC-like DNA-binding protein
MSHDKSGIDYVMLYVKPEKFLQIIDKKEIVKFRDQLVYNKILQKSILDVASSILSGANENISNDLIVNLGEAIQPTLMDQEMIDDILIKRAKNIIDNRLDGPFKLEDVCYDMGISKYKFIRLFKKSSGISPYQYYLNKKVQKVKEIIEKDKDIYRAVEECNFVDLTHMNRHFKGMFGVTPYEYLLNMK